MSNLTIESVYGKFRPKAVNSAEKQCKNLCFYICRRMGNHSSGIHKDIIPLLYEKENCFIGCHKTKGRVGVSVMTVRSNTNASQDKPQLHGLTS